jgi:hypothetical protein
MIRAKILFVGMLVVWALGMVVASSAFAHAFFVEGNEVTKNSPEGVKFEGSSSESKVVAKIIDKELLSIECKTATMTGEFERRGESSGEIKLSSCKVFNTNGEEQAACAISEPIAPKFVGHITIFKEGLANIFEPASSITLMAITLSGGSCSLKGTHDINGKVQCAWGVSIASENVIHKFECLPAGSELALSGQPVEFTMTQSIKVPVEQKWSAK